MNPGTVSAFRKVVWTHYKKHGRHDLPWRTQRNTRRGGKTHDPYKILVSEIMLQQTQVERVIPYYAKFIRKFPTAGKLAKAPLSSVLAAWQGLGYNRRAKMLHGAAKQIVERYRGAVPTDAAELESLWGIGPYTAHAVAAFAYNHDSVFIETNIRTVVLHHFFSKQKTVDDEEILQILKHVLPRGRARDWYSALMDYGSFLKRSGIRTNARVKGYVKQKKFEGSLRQARGAVLRKLQEGPQSAKTLISLLGTDRMPQLRTAVITLEKEKMLELKGKKFRLPR